MQDDDGGKNGENDTLMHRIASSDEQTGFIVQVNVLIDDQDYWAYLMVPAEKYDSFMEAQDKGSCNIKEYGEVIEWGPGTEAPPHILKRIEEDFGLRKDAADCLMTMSDALEERLKNMGIKKD
ncbi:MAG: hypothetical protein EA357_07035 [Micavibrio sp.]|nr:MAG: hypothetical protein EA357_07035 [Micavibrio sp.]